LIRLPFKTSTRETAGEAVQVVGLLRFSYLGKGGFQGVPQDPDAAAAYLFDDARMERRFRLFEMLTIPTLAAQTDRDFTLVVLTAEALPEHHRARLQASVDKLPNALLCPLPPMPQWRAVRDAMNMGLTAEPALSAQFRLDDDDALAVDFVEQLRARAPQLEALTDGSRAPGVSVDFTNGLRLLWGASGVDRVAENRRVHTSQGLTLVTRKRGDKTIMGYPHHKIWHFMPMVCLNQPLMFLQSSHPDQDSGMMSGKGLTEIPSDKARDLLRDRFALDLDSLTARGA